MHQNILLRCSADCPWVCDLISKKNWIHVAVHFTMDRDILQDCTSSKSYLVSKSAVHEERDEANQDMASTEDRNVACKMTDIAKAPVAHLSIRPIAKHSDLPRQTFGKIHALNGKDEWCQLTSLDPEGAQP